MLYNTILNTASTPYLTDFYPVHQLQSIYSSDCNYHDHLLILLSMADQQKFAKLKGTRILIIGGTSGIGYSIAEASIESLAAAVIVSSSNPSRVENAISKLKANYPSSSTEIIGYVCDLGNESSIETNIEKLLVEQCKKLDHIVYSAGDQLALKPLAEVDAPFIQKAGLLRFLGPILVAKHGVKVLPKASTSSYTLTTGVISEKPLPGGWTVVAGYAAGAQGLTRQLGLDLAPIRVNLVSPGPVNTELWDFLGDDVKAERMKSLASLTLTGNVARPEDVAEAYIYLMKDANVTGAMISTSSGSLLK